MHYPRNVSTYNTQLLDDVDINRELKCLFARTNILTRRFAHCSIHVVHTVCVFMIYRYRQTIAVTALANLPLHTISVLKYFSGFVSIAVSEPC